MRRTTIFRLVTSLLLLVASMALPVNDARAIRLEPCQSFGDSARCGVIQVLEDRTQPEGRKISLRVVILESSSPDEAEPLLMFPGGPGQAASGLIPLAQQLYGGVLATRDIVLIGQRGTGESNALHCLENIASDPSLVFGALWPREEIRKCHERSLEHADPSHYGTADYVADIAQALDELGYSRAVLWGGSGGTRTAQAFLREYPQRVVALALDGVTPIDYAMPLPFSHYAQRAWQRVVDDCAAQEDCAAAYPELEARLEGLFTRVAKQPVPTELSQPDGSKTTVDIAAGDLAYALRGLLYSSRSLVHLPREIHRASESGDLGYFAQSLYGRSSALLSGVVAVGLHITSYCVEDIPRLEDVDIDTETRGTFLGRYLVDEYRGACQAWPVEKAGDAWYRDWKSEVPALLISGHYDPSTPDAAAEIVRKNLPNSRHIVVRDMSHGAGFTCARPVVENFLIRGSLEGFENPCGEEPVHFEVGE